MQHAAFPNHRSLIVDHNKVRILLPFNCSQTRPPHSQLCRALFDEDQSLHFLTYDDKAILPPLLLLVQFIKIIIQSFPNAFHNFLFSDHTHTVDPSSLHHPLYLRCWLFAFPKKSYFVYNPSVCSSLAI